MNTDAGSPVSNLRLWNGSARTARRASPRTPRIARRTAWWAAALATCVPAGTMAADAAKPTIGAAAGPEALWLYRRDVDQTSSDGGILRFAYRLGDEPAANRYWPGPVVVGKVALAAVTGRGVHVFFADGSHRHYMPDPRLIQAQLPYQSLLDLRVPLDRPPLAACWDDKTGTLYILITAGQAAEILAAEVPDTLDDKSDEEADDNGDTPTPKPAPEAANATTPTKPTINTVFYSIARLEGLRWILDRPAPSAWDGTTIIVGMLARDGAIHVLSRSGEANGKYQHRVAAPGEDKWSDPTTLALTGTSRPVSMAWLDDDVTVIVQEAAPKGVTISTSKLTKSGWVSGPSLAENAAEVARFTSPLAPALAHDQLMVAYLSGPDDFFVSTWSAKDGSSVETPSIVAPLSPSHLPSVGPSTEHLLQYAVVLALITAYYLWRQGKIAIFVPIAEDQQYARLTNRALALILDLIISAPFWASLLYWIGTLGKDALTIGDQLLLRPEAHPLVWFWGYAIIGSVFAVYATLFEYLMAATPGKRIVGCRVVAANGRRCGLKAAVLRNLVRPIEFHLPAIMLMVFLTPSRQRLGDVLATTVVVEPRREPVDIDTDVDDTTL